MNFYYLPSEIFYLCFLFLAWYLGGIFVVAPKDRLKGGRTTLPKWSRVVLFWNNSGPFRVRTIASQSLSIFAILISTALLVFFPAIEPRLIIFSFLGLLLFSIAILDQNR